MDKIQISKEIRSAIKSSNLEKVVELIGFNAEVLNMITPFGTWLHVAASRGELDIVKKLIELGIDINILGGSYRGGALNEAASEGHINVVKYLLACGADRDISDPIRNPLFGTISNGYPDIAKFLIEGGIDINVKYSGESVKDMDALTFAREQGQMEIVKLIENQKELAATVTEVNGKNQDYHDEILEHVTQYFGSIQNTISEIVPGSRVSVNIHIIPPSMNNDFVTLVTTGMSDAPMDYSNEESGLKYAELLLKLPSSWIVVKDNMVDQNYYWPLEWLRKGAHIYDGWLDEGVILPNGEPPQPFASNTKLSCIMVCRPKESGLDKVQVEQGGINIYTLVPIYEEERNLVLEKGYEYLLKKMNEKGITDVLDINRVNVGL